MLALTHRRPDGTLVAIVNGLPYHLTPGDPQWDAAQALAAEMGDSLPPEPPPPAPDPVAPPALTPRQLRLGLLGLGVTGAQVEAAIAEIPDETAREVALIEWRYSAVYERDHPLIGMVGAALGLGAEQIDAAWAQAAGL